MDEEKLISTIKPHILRCRSGDWEHAQRVAKWVKKLGEEEENLPLIIVAAYIHDIGWRDIVVSEKLTFDKLLELEPQANENSELFVREVLGELGYSEDDIRTVLRLVNSADKHQSSQNDESLIVDADALSKLDINHLEEKFHKSEWMSLYKLWEKTLPERVKTKGAKREYPELLKKLKQNIEAKTV